MASRGGGHPVAGRNNKTALLSGIGFLQLKGLLQGFLRGFQFGFSLGP